MTVLTCASTGKSITLLGEEIANSGEAKVWRTNQNGYLAKIYHSATPERVLVITPALVIWGQHRLNVECKDGISENFKCLTVPS